MKLKRKLIASAITFGLLAGSAQAQTFSGLTGIYVFGDSLSDAGILGNYGGVPTGNASFTTNPDDIWTQVLAAKYGWTITNAYSTAFGSTTFTNVPTGNSFAIGGARADLNPGVFGSPNPIEATIPPISAQVSAFLARGTPSSTALYTVFAGGNDVFQNLGGANTVATNAGGAAGQAAGTAAGAAAQNLAVVAGTVAGGGGDAAAVLAAVVAGKAAAITFGTTAGANGALTVGGTASATVTGYAATQVGATAPSAAAVAASAASVGATASAAATAANTTAATTVTTAMVTAATTAAGLAGATGASVAQATAAAASVAAVTAAATTAGGSVGAAVLPAYVPTALAAMGTAGATEAAQVARLRAAGAKNIVVIGVPNVGATPFGTSLGTFVADVVRQFSDQFNKSLSAGLAGQNVLYIDGKALFETLNAQAARYGITNTTSMACASSFGCVPGTTGGAVSAATAATYAFADGVHPSGKSHQILGDFVYSTLQTVTGKSSPVSLISSVPMGRSGAQWRAIDNQMREFQSFGYTGRGFFITADYSPTKVDATANSPALDGHGNTVTMGYNLDMGNNMFGGVTLGFANSPFELGTNAGKLKYDETAISLFVSKKMGDWYANVIGTGSTLDFKINRNLSVGGVPVTESGETSAAQTGIKTQIGYNFSSGSYVHGPLLAIAAEKVIVEGYAERAGGSSLAPMVFGQQTRKQVRSRIGYQVQGTSDLGGMRFRPYIQITREEQHLRDNRDYTAGFVGTTNALSIATENRQVSYGLLSLGGSLEVSKGWSVGAGATTTFSQSGAKNSSLSLTLSTAL